MCCQSITKFGFYEIQIVEMSFIHNIIDYLDFSNFCQLQIFCHLVCNHLWKVQRFPKPSHRIHNVRRTHGWCIIIFYFNFKNDMQIQIYWRLDLWYYGLFRPNPLGVAILGLDHCNVFLERLLIVCHHPILKENCTQSFHNTMWRKVGLPLWNQEFNNFFHLIFHNFHNLNMHIFCHKTHNPC